MSDCLTLKKSNCKNCYKCIRHCPVKSIRFSAGQAHIIGDECILCGHCFVVCPQNAKQIVDDTEKVRVMLQGKEPVFVSLAPSFIANYNGIGIESMRECLKQLGFYEVEETAVGATMVKREYERILRSGERDIVISSCCHSVNLLIRKYFPEQLMYLADVLSPMQAHCQDIKRRFPGAQTVFIGPCVAKKDEADKSGGIVDAVLSFEELTKWLEDEGIFPEKKTDHSDESLARYFPVAGGIIKTMHTDETDYTYLTIDGIDNCIAALKDIADGNIHHCFVEMSACTGSCIGGPVMEKYHSSPVKSYIAVSDYAGNSDFDIVQPDASRMKQIFTPVANYAHLPTEQEIRAIMEQMGKTRPDDELNCGSCGYNTCRDKAIAIYQGKAEISMCLPFLKDRAESFSDTIVTNSPNAVIVLNDRLEVQQLNNAAQKLLNLRSPSDILGDHVVRILDPKIFSDVLETGKNVRNERIYLAEYKKFVEQTVIALESTRTLICIMSDITEEEDERRRKEEISRQTAEVADKVIEKQMRIVQNIASLLGETAAETKIALTKLKESVTDE
jgi:iron only hydrogenase large subunit-like protein/uncharacterized Fe-S cluster-containing protein